MKEGELVFATLVYDYDSGEGKAYLNCDIFCQDNTTQIDMVQDWITTLEATRKTMQKAALAPKTEEIK